MTAYYNEIDPYAAKWLRNLIEAGHIAPGVVDERSIEDVLPSDLRGFTQCHFFAGIGVWSHALRASGWPDDRPVWTGSCPCQPFSSAGAGAGFEDPRHLWPTFAWLIKECKPAIVFGEQVASAPVGAWVDLVHADVEALGYAFGAVPFPSAGVGAPHIRDRLYWVADANNHRNRSQVKAADPRQSKGDRPADIAGGHCLALGGLADGGGGRRIAGGDRCQTIGYGQAAESNSSPIRLGNADRDGLHRAQGAAPESCRNGAHGRLPVGGSGDSLPGGSAGPVNGLWADADWLFCRDGKWRPAESGTFPLAHGATSRVGRLRAYGNAINAQAATQFIAAYLDTLTTD